MNPRFYNKISADILSGKLLLIVIVVVFSASSFLLGYFVGKLQAPAERVVLTRIEEPGRTETPHSEREDIGEPHEEVKAPAAGPDGDASENLLQPYDSRKDQAPSVGEDKLGRTTEAPSAPLLIDGEKTAEKGKAGKDSDNIDTSGGPLTNITRKDDIAGYYTIQVGAFGKLSDAERLRDSLAKKGYSVVINKDGGRKALYKVRVGRFTTRDAAETVAIRLARVEGLNTFIVKD